MNETHQSGDNPTNPSVRYESTDARFGAVLRFGVGLVLLMVASSAFVWLLLFRFYAPNAAAANTAPMPWRAETDKPHQPRQLAPPPFPDLGQPVSGLDPKPRLEGEDLAIPRADGKRLRSGTARQQVAEEEAYLASLGWIDKEKGVVHIPIAEAMRKVVGKLPARQAEVQTEFLQAPSQASSGREPRGGKP